MARLVLPGGAGGGTATSFIYNVRQASAFWRTVGLCTRLDRRGRRPVVFGALTPGEIVVGHENTVESGAFCWQEHGWAMRGAVRFPLGTRELGPFDDTERAWLTWRKVEDGRTGPFHTCTSALSMIGQARFDWVSGAFASGTAAEKQNLEITGIAAQISDRGDAVVPRSAARGLRRVEVTSIVRDWVARGHPNFGLVLIGDGTFRRPPELVGGAATPFGIRWQACVGIYAGFELVFCPRDHTPSYGRAEADL